MEAMELVLDPPCARALAGDESDERLLELAGLGHERAFEALVERHRAVLLACCRRIAGATGGQDALQQALVSAWHALLRGCEVRNPRAWLVSIARHAALHVAREERRHADELADAPTLDAVATGRSAEEQHEQAARARTALAAIAELPQRERDALVWTSVHGHSGRDAALALGVSEDALRQLVSRARRRARAAFGLLVPPLPFHRLTALAARGTGHCVRRTGALARSHADACSAQMSSALARLSAVAIAGAVAGIPVAVFELHAAQATPSGPAGSQTLRQMTPGAGARHAVTQGRRTAPTPPRASLRPTIHAPARRFAPDAGPPRFELESTAAGEAMSGAALPTATRDGPAASVHAALTAPPAISAHVKHARQGARSVKTVLGDTLSGVRAVAQSSIGAASGADLGAPVISVASTAEGAREDTRSLLGHVAQEGQKQLTAISPLG
jgi:RNA polymerase sigma factor (sigma-70 family)